MLCPKCHKEMIIVERNNIELDYCMFCHGIWFDNNELELLSQSIGVNFSKIDYGFLTTINNDKTPVLKCPRCDKRLDKVIFNKRPPVIDICSRHGIWFDKGELSQYVKNNKYNKNDNEIINFIGEIL